MAPQILCVAQHQVHLLDLLYFTRHRTPKPQPPSSAVCVPQKRERHVVYSDGGGGACRIGRLPTASAHQSGRASRTSGVERGVAVRTCMFLSCEHASEQLLQTSRAA